MPTDVLKVVRQFFPDVLKVEDAKEDKLITVTQEDCRKAEKLKSQADHKGCVLAIACKRQEHTDGAIVARARVYLVKGDTAFRYQSTPAIGRELTAFDRGSDFDPGIYKISKMSESRVRGYRTKKNKKLRKNHPHTSHTKNFQHITKKIRYSIG